MALNNLLGFGNPDAKYIFCGIEEGGIWDLNIEDDKALLNFYNRDKKKYYTNEDLSKALGDDFYQRKFGCINSPVYRLISKFFDSEIKLQHIGSIREDIFIMNLYPLANKNIKNEYPTSYKDIFGVSCRADYIISYFEERKSLIKEFFNKKDRKIILMGKANWDIYKLLYNEVTIWEKKNYCEYAVASNNLIVLTPHPRYFRFTADHLKSIINK